MSCFSVIVSNLRYHIFTWLILVAFFKSCSIAIVTLNPLSPAEKLHFSKMITVNQKTTSNIPVERYCLGYVLNHPNRHTRCHKLNWEVRKVKKWKHSKIPYSLCILGIPLDYSLICSSGVKFFNRFSLDSKTVKRKSFKILRGG